MKTIAMAFIIISLAGCATTKSIQPGTGEKFQVRGRSYDDIWKAATKAVARDLMIVEYDRDKGVIKAETRGELARGGGMVAVFITPANRPSGEYTVEVSSLNQYGVQIAGEDWEKSVAEGIRSELAAGP